VLVVILDDETKRDSFLIPYVLFFGMGMVAFSVSAFVSVMFLRKIAAYDRKVEIIDAKYQNTVAKSKRRIDTLSKKSMSNLMSIARDGAGENDALSLEQKKRKYLQLHQETDLAKSKVSRLVCIVALLVFEDIPMTIITLQMIMIEPDECVASPIEGIGGIVVILSLVISCLLMGVKIVTASGVVQANDNYKRLLVEEAKILIELGDVVDADQKLTGNGKVAPV
jgi:hypothetical protein